MKLVIALILSVLSAVGTEAAAVTFDLEQTQVMGGSNTSYNFGSWVRNYPTAHPTQFSASISGRERLCPIQDGPQGVGCYDFDYVYMPEYSPGEQISTLSRGVSTASGPLLVQGSFYFSLDQDSFPGSGQFGYFVNDSYTLLSTGPLQGSSWDSLWMTGTFLFNVADGDEWGFYFARPDINAAGGYANIDGKAAYPAPIPVPAAGVLLLSGLAAVSVCRRTKKAPQTSGST
ncbi:VPLPA-CTERM sorting domain-containing protein [Mangrovicoccus sp. HB161399]|uniref:VPLPA-CTERM sorting domain-containing protein n=1 Tax=Mangrovicoccus sp. HB161399 TaxID=2720392 RepID=UPI001552D13B|nr:VPLPA-CTERM sorting domain-containing protein [Mangrovicoccus sp. HB161399]